MNPVISTRGIEFWSSIGGAAFEEQLFVAWRKCDWPTRGMHALLEEEYRQPRGPLGSAWLRWRMYAAYAARCLYAALRQRDGVVRVVTTNPFFAPSLMQRFASTNARTINLIYDLYPDALVNAGFARADSWLARRIESSTRFALRECTATVFLGNRLRSHAESKYGAARRAVVIPVGADGAPFRGNPPQAVNPDRDVSVLYAGQMGRMHEIETVGQALDLGIPTGLRLRFHAIGVGYAQLRRNRQPIAGCQWGKSLPEASWQQAMLDAQVALVTMACGAENVVMPSKTYSALVAGQAILAICPPESDLGDLVRKHDCGWVVAPGDVASLRNCWQEIVGNRAVLQAKRLNAFKAGHTHYDVAVLAKQWIQLFDSLTMA